MPSAAGPFRLLGVAICRFRCLYFSAPGNHFHTSGAPQRTILASRDHPGGLWEQQDGLEVVVYRISFDFGVILGPAYINFLSSRSSTFHFFGFVSMSFVNRFLNRNFDAWDFQIEVFARKRFAKIVCSRKSFLMNSGVEFCCFLEAVGAAFLVLGALKIDLKIKGFLVM